MVGEVGTLFVFLTGLTLVLVAAHALGIVADRLGFAPVVGELLTGLVLGPTLLGVVAPGVPRSWFRSPTDWPPWRRWDSSSS